MKITFLGQGFDVGLSSPVGTRLMNFLSGESFSTFTFISAFASERGVSGLGPYILSAKRSYKHINIVVGIDEEGTSKEALEAILNLSVNAFIFYQAEPPIFHPKIYLFEGPEATKLILGSSNLTARGLYSNIENSLLIEFDKGDKEGEVLLRDLKNYYKSLFDFSDPNLFPITKETIGQFVEAGIVINEAEVRRKYEKKATRKVSTNHKLKIPKRETAKIPSVFKETRKQGTDFTATGRTSIVDPRLSKEASFHFPQGVHVGHLLYLLKVLSGRTTKNTLIDPEYVRLHGNFDEGRKGAFQRQTKYKILAMMALGLVNSYAADGHAKNMVLSEQGEDVSIILRPLLEKVNLSFKQKRGDVPSWEMVERPAYFNEALQNFLRGNKTKRDFIESVFLEMPAVQLMYTYVQDTRKKVLQKEEIYTHFFDQIYVKEYCRLNGINVATQSGAEHRCPFLLNILEALDLIIQKNSTIELV